MPLRVLAFLIWRPAAAFVAMTKEERRKPGAAREVIGSVFAGTPGSNRAYCAFLRAAIQHVSQRYNDCWGVTLFDWGVRLNVGWVERLILHPSGLRVAVKEELAPPGTKLDGTWYRRAPECRYTTISLSEIPRALESFTESHHAAITANATRPPPAIRKGHSAGITALLGLPNPPYYPEVVRDGTEDAYVEGSVNQVFVNRYERDPGARDACIRHHGARCSACGFDFFAAYGEVADGFIHVHHLVPVSEIGPDYVVKPDDDLRPVCPNCHAIIHRRTPPYSIKEVRGFLKSRRSVGG